jgi:hypothetical protein
MGFFRIYPSKDAWISNFINDGYPTTYASGSNFGKSPLLRVGAIKDHIVTGSVEWARSLVQFDITALSGKIFVDRTIPSSSVTYKLKMFNYVHDTTVPSSYELFVYPLSRSWTEGNGVDDDTYKDIGYCNWFNATSTQAWTLSGSDYLSASYGSGSQLFDEGTEDLEVTITQIVNNWLTSSIGQAGGLPNNGLVVKLGDTEENNGVDYYIKAFHGRESKYVDRLPYIEARWDDSIRDNRGNFAFNQSNTLYMYNVVRGELTAVTEPVSVRIQDNLTSLSGNYSNTFNAGQISTGIVTASINIVNTASFSGTFYDIWYSGSYAYMTGTLYPLILTGTQADQYLNYSVSTNLKQIYREDEEVRVKVDVRKKNYTTHVLHSASARIDREYIDKMYYSIVNDHTGEVIVPFGTGSVEYTKLSYDGNGNFFNLFMRNFVPGFVYRIIFLIDVNKDKKIIDEDFLFKVV